MIKIEVEDYCHQCAQFEADVQAAVFSYANGVEAALSDTIIRCEHRYRCAKNLEYLKQTLGKEKT